MNMFTQTSQTKNAFASATWLQHIAHPYYQLQEQHRNMSRFFQPTRKLFDKNATLQDMKGKYAFSN